MNNRAEINTIRISIFLLCIILTGSAKSFAQSSGDENDVHVTASNMLRYGTGTTQDAAGNPFDKQYFEEIADTRIFFR